LVATPPQGGGRGEPQHEDKTLKKKKTIGKKACALKALGLEQRLTHGSVRTDIKEQEGEKSERAKRIRAEKENVVWGWEKNKSRTRTARAHGVLIRRKGPSTEGGGPQGIGKRGQRSPTGEI